LRGLAELSGLANLIIQKIGDSPDPTKELFTQWKKTSDVKIETLFEYLEVIDRFDVIDDNKENVKKDIAFAYKIAEEKGLALEELDVKTSITDHGKEALTYDDLSRLNRGQELMQYDAFILYGDDDKEFTIDLVKRLEKQGLKVCIKDRDLLGGAFEHEAVMKLIAERCSKLVPIFSPSFFSSENNKFLTSFAQHVSIEKCTRTLIPILYKTCDIPPNQTQVL
jgi:myeloid differentiation primary response protein MyD88